MAQYDGSISIRINTQIESGNLTSQMMKIVNSIRKSEAEINRLRDRMLELANTNIPTEQYAKLQGNIEKAAAKLGQLKALQESLKSSGNMFSADWKNLSEQAQEAALNIRSIRNEMKELKSAGLSRIEGTNIPTEEYAQLQEHLRKWQEDARQISAEQERLRDSGKQFTSEWNNSARQIRNVRAEISSARDAMQSLENQEQAFAPGANSEEYARAADRVRELEGNIAASRQRLVELNAKQKPITEDFKKIISIIKRIGKSIEKSAILPFKLMGSAAKKAFSSIGKTSKSANGMFGMGLKNILKYAIGIRSLYALFNKLRTAIKEGFSNLAQYSAPVNKSLSMLKSSLTQLKNSLATAFAPILEVVAPALTSLINMLSQAATYVGMLIAALTGKSTFTKAIAVQEDYAASLNKTAGAAKKAAGALASFDTLEVLNKKDSGGGSGAGAVSPEEMFEEVEIPDKWEDIAGWLKDMWEDSDFYELGKLLGKNLKDMLDNIPWEDIKESARRIGKSIASSINGFIEVDDLGYSIGKTLAEAFNTGFEFLNAFVHELHWESLGKFIAETLNGIFENIDWDLIYDTFVTLAKGLGDAINSFADNLNWEAISEAISNFVNTFIDTLYVFITTVDWKELGEKVGKTISDAWAGIDWKKAGETLGEYFKAFFDFISGAIESIDWWMVGQSVKDFLVGIDWSGVAQSFFEAVGAAIGGFAAFIGGLIASGVEEAKQYFEGKIEEAGGDIVLGILKGILEANANISQWIVEHIFTPFIEGFKAAFGIHSPSTVMSEMGGFLIEGLKNGILNAWESLKSTVAQVAESVIGKFRNILGIHSPSTVMDENGVYLIEGLKNGISATIGSVYDLFSVDKWMEIGQNMLSGLSPSIEAVKQLFTVGFSESFSGIYEQLALFMETWTETFAAWQETNGETFFSYDYWYEQFSNILTAYTDMFAEFSAQWQADMDAWWNTMVMPFFDLAQWTLFGTQMKNGIMTGLKSVVNEIGGLLNKIIGMFNSAFKELEESMNDLISDYNKSAKELGTSTLSKVKYSPMASIKVPALADGAVIRGGNPFLAILGDQRYGQTNIEAPLATIEKAVENVMARNGYSSSGNSGSVPVNINLNYNGETFARLSIPDILAELNRQGYDITALMGNG